MWTYPPKRILVAVDFGEASARAVRVAGVLAARYGAHLAAVYADLLEAPPYFTLDQIKSLERQHIESRARAARYLEKFASGQTSAPVEAIIASGPPVEAVLSAARKFDLVVMGTHGRKGPGRWWMGSVAERVVRGVPAPVLVVRATASDAPGESLFERLLVVAHADAVHSTTARYARGLAERFGGEVVDHLSACTEEDARRSSSTLLAIARTAHATAWFGEAAERLIRSCAVPMLFVPEETE
jgi:nucleotide-binding universal stress UspA family protein